MKSCQEKAAVIDKAVQSLGLKDLKQQQPSAIMHFISGQDNLVALPTGYGKSLIYTCLPKVIDLLLNKEGSIDVSVPQHKDTDVFSTLIPAIIASVRTCFHIIFFKGGIITLASYTHVLPS